MNERIDKLLELLSLQMSLVTMDRGNFELGDSARDRIRNLESRIQGLQFGLGLFKNTMLTAKVSFSMEPMSGDRDLATKASLWSSDEFVERVFQASIHDSDVKFVVETGTNGTNILRIEESVRSRSE